MVFEQLVPGVQGHIFQHTGVLLVGDPRDDDDGSVDVHSRQPTGQRVAPVRVVMTVEEELFGRQTHKGISIRPLDHTATNQATNVWVRFGPVLSNHIVQRDALIHPQLEDRAHVNDTSRL